MKRYATIKRRPLAHAILMSLAMSAHAETNQQVQSQAIEEVIVTGQKIERSLQDTPSSVAVVTDMMIEEQGIRDFFEVMERTANIHGQPGDRFNIRGIDAFNVTGHTNSYLASVYVDNAVMPYRVSQQGAFSTWDLQQVEVLRGPQSTLQGRNSLAGAVMINTRNPSYEWDSRFRVTGGQDGREEKAVAFGGALIEDELAFRVAGETKDLDGFNKNITRNENSDFFESENYRAKLLWEPSAMPGLTALLSYHYIEADEGQDWVNVPAAGGNPFSNRVVDFNDEIREFTDTKITTLELNYEINDELSLTSISAYSDADYGYVWDGDQTARPGSVQTSQRNDTTFSQELRLNFDYGDFKGLVGLYYSDLDVEEDTGGLRDLTLAELGITSATILQGLNARAGGFTQADADLIFAQYGPFDPIGVQSDQASENTVESMAIFMDASFRINDRWEVFGGLRWDREEQKTVQASQRSIDSALPDPNSSPYSGTPLQAALTQVNGLLHGFAANASTPTISRSDEFDEVLPKLGVTYHWNEDLNASLSYQKGYRSGGVSYNLGGAYTYSFDPEYTDNYELSLRSQWLDRRLTLNANLFYLDWTDQQIRIQLSGNRFDTETRNAGKSEVKGLEVESSYMLNEELTVYGSVGYAKSEFKDFSATINGALRDFSGRSFAHAPEVTANLGFTYRHAQGFMVNASANYAGDSNSTNTPGTVTNPGDANYDLKNDSRWLVNLRAGYEWQNWAAYVQVTNLLDEEYIEVAESAYTSLGIHKLGAERQVSFSLEANF